MLKDSLGKVGYDDDLLNVYNAFHEALKEEVFKQVAKKQKELGEADQLAASVIEAIEKRVRDSFRWQKFLSKDILKNHAQNFVDASSKSNLPFANFELARIVDRRDPFARRIFLTSLADHRTRVTEQDFLLARAYFFGVFIRSSHAGDHIFLTYPCMLTNQKGVMCRHPCDPFGHHSFCCKVTNKLKHRT